MVLCFAIPGGRASQTVFATVVSTALVVSFAPGKEEIHWKTLRIFMAVPS